MKQLTDWDSVTKSLRNEKMMRRTFGHYLVKLLFALPSTACGLDRNADIILHPTFEKGGFKIITMESE